MTALEVQKGLLENPNPSEECFWFNRTFHGLDPGDQGRVACAYTDRGDTEERQREAEKLLHDLGRRRMPSKLPEKNKVDFRVPWHKDGEFLDRLIYIYFLLMFTLRELAHIYPGWLYKSC